MKEGKVFDSPAIAPPIAEDEGVAPPGRRAFDAIRPPEMELINDCVHCGFCLPTCPTYVLWGEEMDSPRGRIVAHEGRAGGGSEMSPQVVSHWDSCLGCMACLTACPSGVQYDKLIEETRGQIERTTIAACLTGSSGACSSRHSPTRGGCGRSRPAAPLPALRARQGGGGLGLLDRFPRLRTLQDLAPRRARAGESAPPPGQHPGPGREPRARGDAPGLRPARLLPPRERRHGARTGGRGLRRLRALGAGLLRSA